MKFECSITGVQHFYWIVPGLLEGNRGTVGGLVPTTSFNNFDLTATVGRSTLEVVAFAGLNGLNISCEESVLNSTKIIVQPVGILGKNHFIVIV